MFIRLVEFGEVEREAEFPWKKERNRTHVNT